MAGSILSTWESKRHDVEPVRVVPDQREVRTARSRFLLCELSVTNADYPKYPPQPVVRCVSWDSNRGTEAMRQAMTKADGENDEGTMIFRLSQKLPDARSAVGKLGKVQCRSTKNPLVDWSAQLFAVGPLTAAHPTGQYEGAAFHRAGRQGYHEQSRFRREVAFERHSRGAGGRWSSGRWGQGLCFNAATIQGSKEKMRNQSRQKQTRKPENAKKSASHGQKRERKQTARPRDHRPITNHHAAHLPLAFLFEP